MMQIYRTNKESEPAVTEIVDAAGEGCWIRLSYPTETELVHVAESHGLPLEFLKAALDEEERPRIDAEDGMVLVVLDIPMVTEFEGIRTLIHEDIRIHADSHRHGGFDGGACRVPCGFRFGIVKRERVRFCLRSLIRDEHIIDPCDR